MEKQRTGIAILLPGIGYTCDKPLLYYSGKLARSLGWDVIPVPYTGFPSKIRGDRERMKHSFDIALRQTENMLKAVEWQQYDPVLLFPRASERWLRSNMRTHTASLVVTYSLHRWKILSLFQFGMRSLSTGQLIPGRIQAESGAYAKRRVSLCISQKTQITRWKRMTFFRISGT